MASSQATNSPFIQMRSVGSTFVALLLEVVEHRPRRLCGARVTSQIGGTQTRVERALQRPILQPRPRLPSRGRGGASAPPTGTSPAGWRSPRPAMSGAEPCTGSNRPGPSPPSEALGSMPIEPVSMAASSERMSPNMFSVRITSKRRRRGDELHGGVVDEHVLELDVGELARRAARSTTSRHSREVSSTLALSTLVTRAARRREGDARDALDLLARVGADVAGAVLRAGLLAKVDAAGQLAHDEQVGPLDPLAAQRRGLVQRRERLARDAGSRTARAPCAAPAGPARAGASRDRSCPTSGRPTAASSTASAPAAGPSTSSVSAEPCASIEAPPKRCSSNSNSPTARAARSAAAMISGPIPSPGRVAMRALIGR